MTTKASGEGGICEKGKIMSFKGYYIHSTESTCKDITMTGTGRANRQSGLPLCLYSSAVCLSIYPSTGGTGTNYRDPWNYT